MHYLWGVWQAIEEFRITIGPGAIIVDMRICVFHEAV